MAQLTITIPDAQVDRVLTALCTRYGMPDFNTATNAQKSAFVRGLIIKWVKQNVGEHEANTAAAAAADAANADVNNINIT